MAPAKTAKTVETVKEYIVRYDSLLEGKEFIEHGYKYERRADGTKKRTDLLDKPFHIVAGEQKPMSQEVYDILRQKGQILTLEEKEEIDSYKANKINTKSGRAEFKMDAQMFSDEDKVKLFVDLPYVVDIKEKTVKGE